MVKGLGNRIARAAELVGGKRALAAKSGIKESQIYRYISEKNSPNVEVVASIAQAAEVDVSWLITGETNRPLPVCPYVMASQCDLTTMEQGNLKRLTKELRNILDKQDRQMEQVRNLLRGIERIYQGGNKSC